MFTWLKGETLLGNLTRLTACFDEGSTALILVLVAEHHVDCYQRSVTVRWHRRRMRNLVVADDESIAQQELHEAEAGSRAELRR